MDLTIVSELKDLLEQDSTIHAMWIAGSVAEGENDEFSDLDLWIDIDDNQDQQVLNKIEEFLATKGTIDVNFTEGLTPPFTHVVYHLAHMNPLYFIEINLHSHSHKFSLFDSLRKIKVLFDKDKTTKFEPFNEASYNKMLAERKKFLIEKIKFGESSVTKEIQRGQFMEAMHNYQFWLVEPIIELVRIKHSPLKITYSLKHGSRDLPRDAVKAIESLHIIKSLNDLNNKIAKVKELLKNYS